VFRLRRDRGSKTQKVSRPLDDALTKEHEKRATEAKWLLAPPEARTSHVHIALTEGGPITPGLREAVEQLAIELGALELSAQGLKSCSPYKDCVVFTYSNCFAFASCKIANCKTFNTGAGDNAENVGCVRRRMGGRAGEGVSLQRLG
jgi:hypothetical protein